MNAKMRRYYEKKMHGGRSIAARCVDFIVFRLFFALILFFVLLYISRSFTVALLVSLFLTAAVTLILLIRERNKMKRYIERDFLRIKEKCLLETLTFIKTDDYAAYISKLLGGLEKTKLTDYGFTASIKDMAVFAFHNHPGTKIRVSDVIKELRGCDGPIMLVSLSSYDEEVKTMCKHLDNRIELIDGAGLLKMAAENGMLPDEKAAELRAENEMKETILTFEKIKKTALGQTKVKRYIICGVVVLLWSLATGFRIYYPLIASVCFLMAFLSLRQRSQHKESSGTGLS